MAMAMSLYLFCNRRTSMEQYIVHTYYRDPAYIQSQQKMYQQENKYVDGDYHRRPQEYGMRQMPLRNMPQSREEDHYYAEYDDAGLRQGQTVKHSHPPPPAHRQPPPFHQQPPSYRQPYSRSAPPPYQFDQRR